MQNQTNSPRHDGLQSIPWGSTNQQGPPVNKTEYYVSEKPVLLEPEEKRIWGVRKNRFIVFMLLGLFAIGITIIAAVVSANRKTPSRVSQQDTDALPQSTSSSTFPSATSTRPPTPSVTPTVVLLSLQCAGNTSASIFQPRNGGVTSDFGFTVSCGLNCGSSNIFTFERYNVELCATTCAGKADGQCGAMVFSYDGASVNPTSKGDPCLLTTSCMPR